MRVIVSRRVDPSTKNTRDVALVPCPGERFGVRIEERTKGGLVREVVTITATDAALVCEAYEYAMRPGVEGLD